MTFPGPIGTKRRRLRSGGGVSTLTNNNVPRPQPPAVDSGAEPEAKDKKCKGATTIPIFLKSKWFVL